MSHSPFHLCPFNPFSALRHGVGCRSQVASVLASAPRGIRGIRGIRGVTWEVSLSATPEIPEAVAAETSGSQHEAFGPVLKA